MVDEGQQTVSSGAGGGKEMKGLPLHIDRTASRPRLAAHPNVIAGSNRFPRPLRFVAAASRGRLAVLSRLAAFLAAILSLPAVGQPHRPPITGVSHIALFVHDVEKS